ncbi:MAG: DUF5684 domain-containing protein [Chloroflexota bacterium]|nr:DUF5684 domain-containing protein [Chloroflexota bacterium]
MLYGPLLQAGANNDAATFELILLVILILIDAVALWGIFTKAGRPRWPALIPIYNFFVLLRVVGRPWWWMILLIIPLVSIIPSIIMFHDLSKSFGRSGWFTVGLIFLNPIFMLILAFGGSQYRGPAAA